MKKEYQEALHFLKIPYDNNFHINKNFDPWLEGLTDAINDSITKLEKQSPSNKIKYYTNECYFNFIPSKVRNAYAFSYQDTEFIGITNSTFLSLFLISMEFAKDVIKSPVFENESFKLRFNNLWVKDFSTFDNKEEEQQYLAFGVLKLAIYFIYYHEMGHILQGHHLVGKLLLGVNDHVLSENEMGREKLDIYISQGLEIFADNYGIEQITLNTFIHPQIFWGDSLLNEKSELLFTLTSMSYMIVFYLLNISNDGDSLMTNRIRTHPEPSIRMVNAYIEMIETIQFGLKVNVNKNKTFDQFMDALAFSNRAFHHLKLPYKTGFNKDIPDLFKIGIDYRNACESKFKGFNDKLIHTRFEMNSYE